MFHVGKNYIGGKGKRDMFFNLDEVAGVYISENISPVGWKIDLWEKRFLIEEKE